jgi:hypothetical protein
LREKIHLDDFDFKRRVGLNSRREASLNNKKKSSSSGLAIRFSSPPAFFMQSSQDSSRIVKNQNPKKSSLGKSTSTPTMESIDYGYG